MNANNYTQQLGERLLTLRTQAGLTIEDVATLLSTSPARYTKLENGESIAREDEELQVDEVVILCNRYGIGLDDFLSTTQQINLEALLDNLSMEDKEIIRDIIKKTWE